MINSRPYHPQTSGNLGQFHESPEDEIWNYPGLDDHAEYYDTDRLRFSMGMVNCETLIMPFRDKRTDDEARLCNPDWTEGNNTWTPTLFEND